MRDLASRLQGEVLEPAPEHYFSDYSGVERVPPRAVVKAKSAADVAETLRWASKHGVRVVGRGHGCSQAGLVVTDQIVLDVMGVDDVTIDGKEHVKVGAGARWSDLQEKLLEKGLSTRVIVNNPWATVGGTLSVGGYGTGSLHHGGQIDQVKSIDVVTASGDLVHAERNGPHADLFRYTLAGLGQTGVIVKAEIPIQPLKAHSVVTPHFFPVGTPLSEIVELIRSKAPEIDESLVTLEFEQNMWMVYTIVNHAEPPASAPDGAMVVEHYHRFQFQMAIAYLEGQTERLKAAGKITGPEQVKNLWADLYLPADKADEFFPIVHGEINDPLVTRGFYGNVIPNPGKRWSSLPLSPVPLAETVYTFGPYCMVGPSMVDEYKAKLERCTEGVLRLGGRVYLYGWHPKTVGFYERQFGKQVVDEWRAVKAKYDPGNILGARIFG